MTNLKLRNIENTDLEILRNWRNSEEISQYMFSNTYISKQDQKHWFEKICADKTSLFWIVEYDNQPIGFASLTPAEKANDTFSFGLYIGDKNFSGGGDTVQKHFILL